MKEVNFATTNKGKIASVQRVCENYGITVVSVRLNLPEPQTTDLREIARVKVLEAHRLTRCPIIAQDTGFFLSAWNDFPGPFVKFALDTMGLEGFMTLAKERSGECEFRECLAFYNEISSPYPKIFESVIKGTIAPEPRGVLPPDAWSKLWLIFIPEGCTKTIAEMTLNERSEWRQNRGNQSTQLFAEWYSAQK